MISQYNPVFLNLENGSLVYSPKNPFDYTTTVSYTQTTPYIRWSVSHNMNSTKFIIKILNNEKNEIYPDTVYIVDLDNILITFSENIIGTAILHFFG